MDDATSEIYSAFLTPEEGVNRHPKGTPYRRPKGTPFITHWVNLMFLCSADRDRFFVPA
jgi:hypothetical protein